MTLNKISSFEEDNDISVHVFMLQQRKGEFRVLPKYLSKINRDRHVNLLIIHDSYEDVTENTGSDINIGSGDDDDDEILSDTPVNINSHFC